MKSVAIHRALIPWPMQKGFLLCVCFFFRTLFSYANLFIFNPKKASLAECRQGCDHCLLAGSGLPQYCGVWDFPEAWALVAQKKMPLFQRMGYLLLAYAPVPFGLCYLLFCLSPPYWVRTILNTGFSPWLMRCFSSNDFFRIILPALMNVFLSSKIFEDSTHSLFLAELNLGPQPMKAE